MSLSEIAHAKLMGIHFMISTLFVWLNAILYAVYCFWCTLAPDQVMNFLGQSVVKSQGWIEFLAVYGGIEAGLALFFFVCAINPLMTLSGVRLGLCLYGGSVAWRTYALVICGFPEEHGILGLYALEFLLLLLAIAAWFESRLRTP